MGVNIAVHNCASITFLAVSLHNQTIQLMLTSVL